MATRSSIGIYHGDRIKAVYSHWDGSPEYNGRILNQFYRDSVKINRLISMGDISSLGVDIGEQVDFDNRLEDHASGFKSQCKFYTRDRGEDTTWKTFATSKEFTDEYKNWGCEFFYLYKGGKWQVKAYNGRWRSLDRVLASLKVEE